MLERRVYRKPPLIEVFADFSFNDDLPWDTLQLANFYKAIEGQEAFPSRKDPSGARGRRRPGSRTSGGREARPGRTLWQFISAHGDRVVQVGPHRLVLNQLPPYYGWERFRRDAERIIGAYLEIWPADKVESASLHYIDMVVIPGEAVRLEEYFTFYPVFPQPLLERPTSFLAMASQFEGDAPGETLDVSIQHRVERKDQMVSRLQWDYLATRTYRASVRDMIGWLDKAHELTSVAFRASLTQKCEALFEPE